jgi:hypothetical protein
LAGEGALFLSAAALSLRRPPGADIYERDNLKPRRRNLSSSPPGVDIRFGTERASQLADLLVRLRASHRVAVFQLLLDLLVGRFPFRKLSALFPEYAR